MDRFNVQGEFVGNIVMPDTRAVLQDRSNDRNIIMQQVIRGYARSFKYFQEVEPLSGLLFNILNMFCPRQS